MTIYYIKPLWENPNSNFSRKFAQGCCTTFNRGGSLVKVPIEKPEDHCRP